jgi:hypothetical protein
MVTLTNAEPRLVAAPGKGQQWLEVVMGADVNIFLALKVLQHRVCVGGGRPKLQNTVDNEKRD